MESVYNVCKLAKQASYELAELVAENKNNMLSIVAESLVKNQAYILQENAKDVEAAQGKKPQSFIDRLALSESRILDMCNGIKKLIAIDDPVGKVVENWKTPTGLDISKVTVPFGVISIIYEARPNVTADAIGLCLKSGNAVVLRGSKDAILSNTAIVKCIKEALEQNGFNNEYVQLVDDTTRESANALMNARGLIDLLVPRGSANLIKTVVENSIVPVLETGAGNCHLYVEKSADIDKAVAILVNAKTQRVSVCNACESLLIDEAVAEKYLPILLGELKKYNVKVFGCEKTCAVFGEAEKAGEQDFYAEYNDYVISVKVVSDVYEAVQHINQYSTQHSETIITEDSVAAKIFTSGVDSSCVYVNASTRFTDGFQFGFGAEMGISTQKLHARGPVGLKELNSYKYIILGNGNIRK